MDQKAVSELVGRLSLQLSKRRWRLAAAESCTGGWFSKVCTDRAGSSAWFESAVVAYDNRVKQSLLAVPAEVLNRCGAVSEETALAMAHGVLRVLPAADLSVAISGVAGPGGGHAGKPVGTVCFAVCCPSEKLEKTQSMHFAGDRGQVRQSSVLHAVRLVLSAVHR